MARKTLLAMRLPVALALVAASAGVLALWRHVARSDPSWRVAEMLRSPDREDRLQGLMELATYETAGRIDPSWRRSTLRGLLADADPVVRLHALTGLGYATAEGRPADRAVVWALIACLSDPDADVRATAVAALRRIRELPEDAESSLLAAARAADPELRAASMRAVGLPPTRPAAAEVRGLAARLLDDPAADPELHAAAIDVLAPTAPHDPAAARRVLAGLAAPHPAPRRSALAALQAVADEAPGMVAAHGLDPLLAALASGDAEHARGVASAIGSAFAFGSAQPGAEALATGLIGRLSDPDASVRAAAAAGLEAAYRLPAESEAALRALASDGGADPDARRAALRVIGRHFGEVLAPPAEALIAGALRDPEADPARLAEAIRLVRPYRLNDPTPIRLALAHLDAPDPGPRAAARDLLSMLGAAPFGVLAALRPEILAALASGDEATRAAAAWAAAGLGEADPGEAGRSALPALRAAFGAAAPGARREGYARAAFAIDPGSPEARAMLDRLVADLDDPDPAAAAAAARDLRSIHQHAAPALPALRRLAASGSPAAGAALEALDAIENRRRAVRPPPTAAPSGDPSDG